MSNRQRPEKESKAKEYTLDLNMAERAFVNNLENQLKRAQQVAQQAEVAFVSAVMGMAANRELPPANYHINTNDLIEGKILLVDGEVQGQQPQMPIPVN